MKKILRFASALLCGAMLLCSLSVTAFAENDDEVYDFDPNTDKIYSEAVYMVNTDTGDVVYKKNESKKMYPASTTKIMTCIIALEHLSEGSLSKKVEVPYDCFNDFYEDPNYSDPSNAAIEPLQDNLTYKDCLYALMLPSACEAANILAYNIGGGSITKFIGMMNEKAKELGCTGTNFVNAHGLHNDNNYTTAEDLYKMTKYAYDKFPLFKKITSTYEYEMPKNDANPSGYSIYSTISLLRPGSVYEYEYAYGTKTGTTNEAGRCLVSAAKNQYNYILVTLGAPVKDKNGEYYDDWYSMIDALNLYKWAFTNFEMATVVNKDEQITEVKVEMGESATQRDISGIGTPFFRSILTAVQKIPYGERVTYMQAAEMAGSKAVRACGSALKRNPLPILIPCHRIVPASGGIGCYMGTQGIDIKKFVLETEERYK